jgi:hypothetical protein
MVDIKATIEKAKEEVTQWVWFVCILMWLALLGIILKSWKHIDVMSITAMIAVTFVGFLNLVTL